MDVRLYDTLDGGEIDCTAGQLVMSDGLETVVFLSLFGGNLHDSGLAADDAKQFWGNLIESDPDARYRGQLQALLNSSPLTPANLNSFQDAATSDLAWMVPSIAQSVVVNASMPALDTIQFDATIVIDGTKYPFQFLTGTQ